MPNSLAFLMLTVWPFVTLAMYLWMPPRSAVIWSILAGYLLLPAAVVLDLPGLPGLSKHSIPSIFGYVYASLILGQRISLLPRSPMGRVFVVILLVAPFLTVATNGDPVFISSQRILPGLRPYDALSALASQFGAICIWALAREILRDGAALRQLVVALVIAYLFYTVPMLWEVRMSPQLHTQIYGFFQHEFLQMMRQGGFRPIVFLEHGLWIALLTAMTAMLSVVLARSSPPEMASRWYMAAAYLMVVLVLCKSMAALAYALLMMPALLMFTGERLARIAMLMCILVLSFPILRTLDLIPTEWMVEMAGRLSAERAQSLDFRFFNEDALLGRAMERPLFGWGGWGRSSIYDPITGGNVSVSDGLWVIVMGHAGFTGFIAQFGLMTLPVFMMRRAYRAAGREIDVFVAGVGVVLAVNLVDLLPNATISPVTWLLSGAMLGRLESLRQDVTAVSESVALSVMSAPSRGAFAGLVGQAAQGPRSLI